VKATATVTPQHAAGLSKWLDMAGGDAASATIVADVDRSFSVAPRIRAKPWWVF